MNVLITLLAVFFIAIPSVSQAETVPASSITAIQLSALSTNYRYLVNISRDVIPKKMTGNPFRESFLQARCGDQILATDTRRIAATDFGKTLSFALNFELSSEICESLDLTVELQVNGITIESPNISYTSAVTSETSDYFLSRTRSELTNKQLDLVFYHGEMSKSAGSRRSLHCLIKTYELDPSFDSIITDLKGEYKKLFGADYVMSDIDCVASITLNEEIASCSTPAPKRTFCAFYTLYGQTIQWFQDSVQGARDQKAFLRHGELERVQKLDDLIQDIESEKSLSLNQIGGGV